MTNGWKKIKSKIIHQNPWYVLREDDVIMPNGKEGKYFYMDGHDGVVIIAEAEDGEVYIVGQNRYPIGNVYSWEVIAGGINSSESPIEAAKRELREEAGLEAQEWKEIGYIYSANFNSSARDPIFIASNLKRVKDEQDSSENITVQKISVDKLKKMIKDNEMACGFSIACFHKYFLYRNL
jgi:ADP-ribose pyrophosphatase YjhB (NUDIX family)